ncbi:MAG: ACP S-malonyltransferase [Candidatus Promineifilaceae bacterium]
MSVAFLFPGQGSQHVGMGFDLYQTQPVSRAVFDLADQQLGFSLSDLCFNGPEEELVDTVNQQPALLVTSIAILRAMQAAGSADPEFVAGHSMGEFSALVAAGSLTFTDGLALVRKRGELMKEAGEKRPGAMAAILALETNKVEAICDEAAQKTGQPVQLANDNCPGQLVISGDETALAEAMELAQAAGARKVVKLPISIAAHSELMRSAADGFARAVDDTPLAPPRMPIIGNVSAQPLTTPEAIRAELKAQLTSSVRWTDSMTHLTQQGVDTVYEVGPGDVLLGLMKRIDRSVNRKKSESEA